jgi:hypothetical protein
MAEYREVKVPFREGRKFGTHTALVPAEAFAGNPPGREELEQPEV